MRSGGPLKARLGTLSDGSSVEERLDQFLKECIDRGVRPAALILIGSRARGDWKPWSDIDLVIVAEGLEGDRLAPFLPAYKYGIEPRAYTPDHLLAGAMSGDITALEALDGGVVVYDEGVWGQLKARFQEIKEELGLERVEGGWVAKTLEEEALREFRSRRLGGGGGGASHE